MVENFLDFCEIFQQWCSWYGFLDYVSQRKNYNSGVSYDNFDNYK